jgi:uncharacterized membrane protein
MSEPDKTVSGWDPNVVAALTYLLGWVSGLLFLALEPHNRFVRFHAMQSVLVFGPACIAFFICLSIPLIGWLAAIVIFYGSAVLWLLLMFKAYQGQRFKLPIAGEMAEGRI